MSIGSPKTAPARTDLPFLRHRSRPATAKPPAAPPPSTGRAAPAVEDFLHGRGPRRPGQPAPHPSGDLDLSTAMPAARPETPGPARSGGGTYQPPRVRTGTPTILTPKAPTVTLTRVQSGVGVLAFEAVCSEAVGDLRLGCAYELRSGQSSIVQHASGVSTAPANSRRPVIKGERDRFERLTLDLMQSRDVERLVIYAFSQSAAALTWGAPWLRGHSGRPSSRSRWIGRRRRMCMC